MARVIHITARIGSGLWHALRRLDDHWIGDLIGAVCVFLMLWIGLVIVGVYQ